MQPAPDQSPNFPQATPSGAARIDPDTAFRCLHYRASELTAELIRAAEGKPGTFQRDYHTGLAGKKLAEIAAALGFEVVTRIPVDADAHERDDDGAVWLTPADIAGGAV